jgi:Predicted extracellular endo alpha-1,4 polygalactosaminidase or related polysaccharide hydrolase
MNPLHICYKNDAHLRAEQYAGTTSAFVLGRFNCTMDEWQRCRDRGSEVYRYMLYPGRPDNRISTADEEIYMGDSSKVPLWPYLDANGNRRSHYAGSKMTDIRVGSAWVKYSLDYFAKQLRLHRYDGYFLDTFGGKLWASAKWNEWPVGEQQEWTAGAVDFIRQLDEVRRTEDPLAIIVCNNNFDNARDAEKYIDGVCSESHDITNAAMQRIVGKPYGNLGHRRVFSTQSTLDGALAWSKVPGITHVCCNAQNIAAGDGAYSYPSKPVVGYSRMSADEASLRESYSIAIAERDKAIAACTVAQDKADTQEKRAIAAETAYVAAAARGDAAQLALDAANAALNDAQQHEAAAAAAAYNLQQKIIAIRSIVS